MGKKVHTDHNPADLMTKHLSADMIERHSAKLSASWPGGRADKAPNLSLFITRATWEEEEPESEEEQPEENWLDRVQDVVAGVWEKKWKAMAKRAIRKELSAS